MENSSTITDLLYWSDFWQFYIQNSQNIDFEMLLSKYDNRNITACFEQLIFTIIKLINININPNNILDLHKIIKIFNKFDKFEPIYNNLKTLLTKEYYEIIGSYIFDIKYKLIDGLIDILPTEYLNILYSNKLPQIYDIINFPQSYNELISILNNPRDEIVDYIINNITINNSNGFIIPNNDIWVNLMYNTNIKVINFIVKCLKHGHIEITYDIIINLSKIDNDYIVDIVIRYIKDFQGSVEQKKELMRNLSKNKNIKIIDIIDDYIINNQNINLLSIYCNLIDNNFIDIIIKYINNNIITSNNNTFMLRFMFSKLSSNPYVYKLFVELPNVMHSVERGFTPLLPYNFLISHNFIDNFCLCKDERVIDFILNILNNDIITLNDRMLWKLLQNDNSKIVEFIISSIDNGTIILNNNYDIVASNKNSKILKFFFDKFDNTSLNINSNFIYNLSENSSTLVVDYILKNIDFYITICDIEELMCSMAKNEHDRIIEFLIKTIENKLYIPTDLFWSTFSENKNPLTFNYIINKLLTHQLIINNDYGFWRFILNNPLIFVQDIDDLYNKIHHIQEIIYTINIISK